MFAQFAVGQVLWSIVWFTVFFMWIMLVFQVVGDVFRSHDLGGGAKALWLLFVIVTPYLGVFIYLIARGSKMRENQIQAVQAQNDAVRQYVQSAAGPSTAGELVRLADLHAQGVIDDTEFAALKAKLVN